MSIQSSRSQQWNTPASYTRSYNPFRNPGLQSILVVSLMSHPCPGPRLFAIRGSPRTPCSRAQVKLPTHHRGTAGHKSGWERVSRLTHKRGPQTPAASGAPALFTRAPQACLTEWDCDTARAFPVLLPYPDWRKSAFCKRFLYRRSVTTVCDFYLFYTRDCFVLI